jgi:hypothetical protein
MMVADTANLQQLLDRDVINIFLKFTSLAHLNPDQIGNMLARLTDKTLLLKDSDPIGNEHTSSMLEENVPAEADGVSAERKAWIPDDAACPKIWYVAPPHSSMPPPVSSLRGPYKVSELKAMFDRGDIGRTWYAAPSSAEDYAEEQYETIVDTGLWRRVQDYFQVLYAY